MKRVVTISTVKNGDIREGREVNLFVPGDVNTSFACAVAALLEFRPHEGEDLHTIHVGRLVPDDAVLPELG